MTVDFDIEHARLIEAIPRHMRRDGTVNYTTLGAEFDRHRSNMKKKVAALGASGALGYSPVVPGMIVKTIATQYRGGEVVGESIRQAHEGEITERVPKGFAISHISTYRDAHGRTTGEWTKLKEDPDSVNLLAEMKGELEGVRGKSELIEVPVDCDSDLMTIYPIADAHLGLLAWGRETGVPYDLDIALAVMATTMAELVSAAPRSGTAIILNMGDFTHANDETAATPANRHQLDVDGRFPKTARAAIRIARQMIELALTKHERVIYRGIPGNHDRDVAHLISIGLELFFENNSRVWVDNDPSDFFHYKFGKVMIAANHGHRLKAEDLPGVMAAYWPKIWGETEYRYAFSAHYHQIKTGEKHGAVWEILRSSAAKDSYSHSHGYSSGRSINAITYHAERGEKTRTIAAI